MRKEHAEARRLSRACLVPPRSAHALSKVIVARGSAHALSKVIVARGSAHALSKVIVARGSAHAAVEGYRHAREAPLLYLNGFLLGARQSSARVPRPSDQIVPRRQRNPKAPVCAGL